MVLFTARLFAGVFTYYKCLELEFLPAGWNLHGTESRNHRIAEVGRHIWRSSG